jgi:hypothetical protein
MFKRATILLFAGFALQFLISCDINCNSGPTFEMIYTDLRLVEKARIDGDLEVVEDSVKRENFVLGISFNDQEKELAYTNENLHLGFNTARALDCGPYYIYPDKVESLSIEMLEQGGDSQFIDVTDLFEVNRSDYSIEEWISIQSEEERGGNYFNLSLREYEGLYKKSTFRVTATLESGETFTQETEEIIFMD